MGLARDPLGGWRARRGCGVMMSGLDRVLERLEATPCCGYAPTAPVAAEPTALAALALTAAGRHEAASRAASWLADQQNEDGSVGVWVGQPRPCWPTGLALVAWTAVRSTRPDAMGDSCRGRAANYLLQLRSEVPADAGPPDPRWVGHDARLVSWPWVAGTHGWVEPTSLALLGLAAVGHTAHPRAVQGTAMLLDRQLPGGGWNYGNTTVLGQMLRPHVQPTGLALVALASLGVAEAGVAQSLDYLTRAVAMAATPRSLSWAVLGLAAYGRRPAEADELLAASADRFLTRQTGGDQLALMALAAHDASFLWMDNVFAPCNPNLHPSH